MHMDHGHFGDCNGYSIMTHYLEETCEALYPLEFLAKRWYTTFRGLPCFFVLHSSLQMQRTLEFVVISFKQKILQNTSGGYCG